MNEPIYISPGEKGFKGRPLDDYLALGYFCMQNFLFTTYSVPDGYYGRSKLFMPVFWLRTVVNKISEKKSALTIRRKCVAFTVCIKKACINEEIEVLYSLYRNHIHFSGAEKCIDILDGDLLENPFDSWMIEVRNGTILIAVGYFDKGNKAIMGILNFYHPDYQKYSLGKYLMLKTVDYALTNGISYYYTGYISTAINKFDYKLFPDVNAIEVYLPIEKEWVPYTFYNKEMLEEYFLDNLFV